MLRKEDPQQWTVMKIHVGMYAMLQMHIQNICVYIYIIYLCVGTKLLAKNNI